MSQLTFLYGKVDMVPPPPEALINQAYNIKKLAKQILSQFCIFFYIRKKLDKIRC